MFFLCVFWFGTVFHPLVRGIFSPFGHWAENNIIHNSHWPKQQKVGKVLFHLFFIFLNGCCLTQLFNSSPPSFPRIFLIVLLGYSIAGVGIDNRQLFSFQSLFHPHFSDMLSICVHGVRIIPLYVPIVWHVWEYRLQLSVARFYTVICFVDSPITHDISDRKTIYLDLDVVGTVFFLFSSYLYRDRRWKWDFCVLSECDMWELRSKIVVNWMGHKWKKNAEGNAAKRLNVSK